MKNNSRIKISVRELIEFILRSGSIDNRFVGKSGLIEGVRGHQKIQKSYAEEYEPEVSIKYEFQYKDILILIEGRADGIIKKGGTVTIDEIKTISNSFENIDEDYNHMHWAQAKCYAYMYAVQNDIEKMNVQLTYFQIDTGQVKIFHKEFCIDTLKDFFLSLVSKYYEWAKLSQDWCAVRDLSIKKSSFPFNNYRKGQRELAVAVYKIISLKKKLFVQAPTGIGKTISSLFPAIKAIGEDKISRIFYLTAKTSTRFVIIETVDRLRKSGVCLKTTVITAKDKVCFKERTNCNPQYCEYADGHYSRINEAVYKALNQEDMLTRETIEKYAQEFMVCPFEFTLDLTLWSDIIICDYNYVFDPRVYLKRFFENTDSSNYAFLIDEAHNLVERAREMFSAELLKSSVLKLKKLTKGKATELSAALGKLNKLMINIRKQCEDSGYYISKSYPEEMKDLIKYFITQAEEYLSLGELGEEQEELLELYFDATSFSKILELYDERYVTYFEKANGDIKVKLFCLDPSNLLNKALKRGGATVFFSATLIPLEYFQEILGGGKDDSTIRLNSPFDIKNRCLLISDRISTKYKDRDDSYVPLVEYIRSAVEAKKGNYIAFFPSYQYMNEVYTRLKDSYPGLNTIVQKSDMSEQEKEEFLEQFDKGSGTEILAFCVLGGTYAESIDLIGSRLIGAIIVGVGLPQLSTERDIIKQYFQEKNGLGYEYAYIYPGMIKVLQAAGRVIRTEDDKGIILLIDERYSKSSYRRLFPKEWYPSINVKNHVEVSKYIRDFWESDDSIF